MEECAYYQAHVVRKECCFLVAILRSFEHLLFDRTLDKNESIFEFFVPVDNEKTFLELMQYLEKKEVVHSVTKLPSRLADPHAQF